MILKYLKNRKRKKLLSELVSERRAGDDLFSSEEKAAFDAVDLGKGVLSQSELLAHRLPEMPAKLVPVIEEIWLNEVVGK